jgi:hypothetical protein
VIPMAERLEDPEEVAVKALLKTGAEVAGLTRLGPV